MKKIKTVFNVVDATDDKPARMNLYGFIGSSASFWDTDAQDITTKGVTKSLDEIEGDTLDVHINSTGGDAFEGIGIYNALKQSDKTINVYIDALAASAASVIAMAGDTIFMPKNAQMMVHHAATFEYGNVQDFEQVIKMLNKMDNSLIASYESRFKGTSQELTDLLDAETFLNADEAVAFGFADKILDYSDDKDEDKEQDNIKSSLFAKYGDNKIVANANNPEPGKEPINKSTNLADRLANLIAKEGN
ncbi:head maturation protease, ClpP-related [Companilactobacillus sp. HBUAS56275]|uniref:head maturation protease, ClpP-related n=1 Tax=Companilactobacillus sp. HBUAS56275 TaxID=3109364 RepID=UPI002FF05186